MASEVLSAGWFSIWDWTGYPAKANKPKGPFTLLEGDEYKDARKAANKENARLHRTQKGKYSGKDIHEITPVKFGGSPTDGSNKLGLSRKEHSKYTTFWNRLMRAIK